MFKKSSITAILVTILAIGVIGYFMFVKKGEGPVLINQQTTGSTEDKTANWKTYRNEQYGFEFKYPSDSIGFNLAATPGNTTEYYGLSFVLLDPEDPISIGSIEKNHTAFGEYDQSFWSTSCKQEYTFAGRFAWLVWVVLDKPTKTVSLKDLSICNRKLPDPLKSSQKLEERYYIVVADQEGIYREELMHNPDRYVMIFHDFPPLRMRAREDLFNIVLSTFKFIK